MAGDRAYARPMGVTDKDTDALAPSQSPETGAEERTRRPLLVAPRAALAALGICFAVRGLLYATGTRFSTAYLTYGWQIVPAETLARDPFGSVWYLHIQPPLFNLMTGVLLRWSPFSVGITFQVVYLAIVGLLIVVSQDLFVRLGASPTVAAGITVFVFCDPDWLRYE